MRTNISVTSLLIVCVLALAGCDAHGLLQNDSADDAVTRADRARQVQGSVRGSAGDAGDCPCFTAAGLAEGFAGSAAEPYLFFDTYNWHGLDRRRTEVRATVAVHGSTAEEVASVYVTPVEEGTWALMCYRQDVSPDPYDGEAVYTYTTIEPTVRQAEACRRAIYAFARDLECQGPACGVPYDQNRLNSPIPPQALELADEVNPLLQQRIAIVESVLSFRPDRPAGAR